MSAPAIALSGSIQREAETDQIQQQQQNIANLAYALWQQRGCPKGSPEQDWGEAEKKLREEQQPTALRR